MSEYQYYEFQAIDRPLTKAEMAAVRALSTRATITPTRFQNEYHWGDFKGDPLVLMERYYDAHVYYANWGTRQFMLRLPRELLDAETVLRYCFSDWAEVHTKGEFTILDFIQHDAAAAVGFTFAHHQEGVVAHAQRTHQRRLARLFRAAAFAAAHDVVHAVIDKAFFPIPAKILHHDAASQRQRAKQHQKGADTREITEHD